MTINEFVYSKQPGIRILRHVLFWVTDLACYIVIISDTREITSSLVLGLLSRIPLIILLTYFILYYLIPTYSKNPHKGKLFLWTLCCMAYIGLGMRYQRIYIVNPIVNPDLPPVNFWNFSQIVGEIFAWILIVFVAMSIKLIKNKTELQQKNEQLLKEKKIAELNFLKAQMHPHFLFNTLNTLYSEAILDSGKAQLVVLHLSNLLRFILDECNKPLIEIGKEIKVIKDFIALEELRHGTRLNVSFTVSDIDADILISPLILMPFVENSFKHSLNNKRGNISINIRLNMREGNFYLFIENDKEEARKPLNGHSHGKGISNVRRQLELLYGKSFSLQINDEKTKYRVELKVPSETLR